MLKINKTRKQDHPTDHRQICRFVKEWNEQITKNGGIDDQENVPVSSGRKGIRHMEEANAPKISFSLWRKDRWSYAIIGGKIANGRAMALDTSVNSYLGGVTGGVPSGTVYNEVQLVRSL